MCRVLRRACCTHIHHCAFGDDQGVANLSNLRELRLANNNISRIEGLADLPLRALDLSHNALTELGGLSTLSKLQVLNVSHNKIESMRGVEVRRLTRQHMLLGGVFLTHNAAAADVLLCHSPVCLSTSLT